MGVDALQKPVAAYGAGFEGENEGLRAKNRFFLEISDDI